MDRAGIPLEFEPGQQRNRLRVIGKSVHRDRNGGILQVFDYIAVFEYVLTLSRWIQPERRNVVNAVKSDEGVVEDLCHFMAVRGNVFDAVVGSAACGVIEQSGGNPARVVQNVESRPVAV